MPVERQRLLKRRKEFEGEALEGEHAVQNWVRRGLRKEKGRKTQ